MATTTITIDGAHEFNAMMLHLLEKLSLSTGGSWAAAGGISGTAAVVLPTATAATAAEAPQGLRPNEQPRVRDLLEAAQFAQSRAEQRALAAEEKANALQAELYAARKKQQLLPPSLVNNGVLDAGSNSTSSS